MNPGAFAIVRAVVWTLAALRVLPRLPGPDVPELRAAQCANRFLELWLYQWGPTFAPEAYKTAIDALHESMPQSEWIIPPDDGRARGHAARANARR